MPEQPESVADFDPQDRPPSNDIFHEIVRDAIAAGDDPAEQARHYVERGKPDLVLAFLLVSSLPDDERCELLAQAYERHAAEAEAHAREFDRKFHRPFLLLFSEAAKDRATAKQIRAGGVIQPGVTRQLPLL